MVCIEVSFSNQIHIDYTMISRDVVGKMRIYGNIS